MKHLIILCLLLRVSAPPEKYYVIYARGRVHVTSSAKTIKTGDELNAADRLIFDLPGSKVICMNAEKGRVEIVPGKTKSASGELWAVLRSNILPVVSHYRFSTRGMDNDGYDPGEYFESAQTGGRILLINGQSLPIAKSCVLDSADFFFLQYERNSEQVTRKIRSTVNGITFDLQDFSAVSADQLPAEVTLCYQSVNNGVSHSRAMATFKPVLRSKAELESEIRVIRLHDNVKSTMQLKNDIRGYLYDTYGKIGDAELNTLLN